LIGGINGLLAHAMRDSLRAGANTSRDVIHRARAARGAERTHGGLTSHGELAHAEQIANQRSVLRPEQSDRSEKTSKAPPGQYSEAERREIERLKARDREVRAHENAHKAAAGAHARGGPHYEFTTGPDDKQYAVSGSVSIDTSEVPDDPEKTLAKMEQIRRAALAPAEPSAQDARVAAEATQTAAKARQEILQEKHEARGSVDLPTAARNAYTRREHGTRIDIRA